MILAQGDGRRWETDDGRPYLGRPKQLLEVDGETLVARTARQFTQRGCDVIVIGDERISTAHGRRVELEDPWPIGSDMSKFVGTQHLWSETERTLILWGDCFYSDELADQIVNYPGDELHYFRRVGASKITGCRWDESFAVTFGPEDQQRVIDVALEVHGEWEAGRLKNRKGTHLPIRNHYAAHIGERLDNRRILVHTEGQTAVDDWSDDIDSPREFREWFGRYYTNKINLAVCIPWFGGDQWRTVAWEYTKRWFETLGVSVYAGEDDSGGEWTNRSRGCNNSARQAIEDGAEVLLIGDADTVLPGTSMWAAAHAARMTRQLVLGYTEYNKLGPRISKRVYGGDPIDELKIDVTHTKHVSGAVFVTPELFEKVGGFDERFDSWGGEDRAFWMACFTLAGGYHRIEGPAYHLWHPRSPQRDPEHPNKKRVQELGRRYKRASGWLTAGGMLGKLADEDTPPKVSELVALMSEPGGPLEGHDG